MADEATKPIVVSANAGGIDAVQSTVRYVGVLITAFVAVVGLLRAKDLAGLALYVQNNGGDVLAAASGLASLGIAAYGVFKSHKRGAQIATAAADPTVPDSVVALKDVSKGDTNA